MTDRYTMALERRVRLLLKEQDRLIAEVRQLRSERLDLAERLRRHEPKERAGVHVHAGDLLALIAEELATP